MSETSNRIHERIEWFVNYANDFLDQFDVELGYGIPHTHNPDGSAIADNDIIRADVDIKRNIKRNIRRRLALGKVGSQEDHDALDDGASTITDVDVLFELRDKNLDISVYRVYKLSTLRNLVTDDTKTREEKKAIIKNQLQTFYQELQARINA